MHQPRLPDPGGAEDGEEDADSIGDGLLQPIGKRLALTRPADHRCVGPPRRARHAGRNRKQAVGADRLLLALDGHRVEWLGGDGVANEPVGRVADDHVAGAGGLLQALRQVHRVAGDEALTGSRVARHDLAGIDADAPADRRAQPISQLPSSSASRSRTASAARTARNASSS